MSDLSGICNPHGRLRCGDCIEREGLVTDITEFRAEIQTLKQDVSHWKHEADIWLSEVNRREQERLTLQTKLALATEALENCTGGDLASGEGIYKAEVAREALAKIGQTSARPDTHILRTKLHRAKEILGSMHADLSPQHKAFFHELDSLLAVTEKACTCEDGSGVSCLTCLAKGYT